MRDLLIIISCLIKLVTSYNSCLQLRSFCLRSAQCRPFLDKFETSCGYNVDHCTGPSPSDCVHTLRQIREFFPYKSCICYEALGSQAQCEWFRQAMYSNPCEKRLEDVEQERKIANLEEFFDSEKVITKPDSGEPKPVTEPSAVRRTTRSPIQERIREWKEELSTELETRDVIRKLTCNEALYDICLRHVSCKQLWKLFRQSCDVDAQNECRMQHRETCWQSFEGLTWTGLGSCHCTSNNSDCHWIRLHTNYNKCIYEISRSGEFPAHTSFEGRSSTGPPMNPPAPLPPPTVPLLGQSAASGTGTDGKVEEDPLLMIPNPDLDYMPVIKTTTRISHATPPPRILPTDRHPPPYTPAPAPMTVPPRILSYEPVRGNQPDRSSNDNRNTSPRPTSAGGWWNTPTTTTTRATTLASPSRDGITGPETIRYRAEDTRRPDPRTRPTPSPIRARILPSRSPPRPVATPPPPRHHVAFKDVKGPTSITDNFRPKERIARSSCQDAMARCQSDSSCGWHIAELTVRCRPSTCKRDECALALQRFTSYVARPLSEPMMFCHCSSGDNKCLEQQALLYPKCLYTSDQSPRTCTEVVIDCSQDVRCNQLRTSIASVCPVSKGECATSNLDHCRQTLLYSRGSLLEAHCFCPMSDMECLKYQASMIPNNPCIEKAMLDYSKLMGYMTPSRTLVETNRISSDESKEVSRTIPAQHTSAGRSGSGTGSGSGSGSPPARTSPGRGGGIYSGRTETATADTSGTKEGTGRATQGSSRVKTGETLDPSPQTRHKDHQMRNKHPKTTSIPEESDEIVMVTAADEQLIEMPIHMGGQNNNGGVTDRKTVVKEHSTSGQNINSASVGFRSSSRKKEGKSDSGRGGTESAGSRTSSGSSSGSGGTQKDSDKEESEGAGGSWKDQNGSRTRSDALKEDRLSKTTVTGSASEKNQQNRKQEESWKKTEEEKFYKMNREDEKSDKKKKPTSAEESETAMKEAEKLPRPIQRQKQRTTMIPPTTTKSTSSEIPPWVTTTTTLEPPTTEYVTIAPPVSEDGCTTKDANGKELFFHLGSVVRRHIDWAGRCSSWCECSETEQLSCERLPCHADSSCEAPLTEMEFGERLYLQGRGACMCESGVFVCDTPEEMPELYAGLYVLAGYSIADLEMLRREIPGDALEKAGFLSSDVAKDIASRLQWALERRLPEDLKCRIVMMEDLSEDGNAFYKVEWYGQNENLNHTREQWYADGAEKVCSPYVRKLVESFALNESPRFQLILSIVKQLRVIDLLDGLPVSGATASSLGIFFTTYFVISWLL